MYKPNNYNQQPQPSNYGNIDQFQMRVAHVNNLLMRYPNSRIVSHDKAVVDVPVLMKSNNFLNFRVLLHPPFPATPPIIKLLATAAEHKFLDRNQLVVHERLRMWHANDHLGDALLTVFQDFINNPPRIISYAVQNTRNTPSPMDAHQSTPSPPTYQQTTPPPQSFVQPTYPSSASSLPPQYQQQATNNTSPQTFQQPQQSLQLHVPPIPDIFPEIEELALRNPQQIQSLLDSEWQFKEWFDKLSYVTTVQQLFDDLRKANMDIARENIKRNKDLEERSNEWKKLTEELQELKVSVQDKQLKQKEVNERYQPQNVLKVLNQKIDEVEEESEDLGQQFAIGGGDFEEFQRKYMEKRTLFHLRQEKKIRFAATYVK